MLVTWKATTIASARDIIERDETETERCHDLIRCARPDVKLKKKDVVRTNVRIFTQVTAILAALIVVKNS